jgi:hypothetical protein
VSSPILERDWNVLLESLERGNCVVLLGPNLHIERSSVGPCNLTTELSRRLAGMLENEDEVRVRNPDNLPLVAQVFIDRNARSDLEYEVTKFYGELRADLERGAASGRMFEDLAALPFGLFVTTRHDPTLSHYLQRSRREPVEKGYHFHGDQQRSIGTLGSVGQPLVYSLFGSTDTPASLAVTETNLLDLLEAIISGNPGLPVDLHNHFQEKSFLFLGCGLHKDYLRFLLHALGLSRSRQRSFALEAISNPMLAQDPSGTLMDRVWFYEVEYRKLKFLEVEEGAFLREVRKRWNERHPEPDYRPDEGTQQASEPERPRTFISYMNEDRSFADHLARSLETRGIDPWIDVDGGTKKGPTWEQSLDDAIARDVDFFVVLLSRHLADGVDTYVHREVQAALRRKSMRGAVKFLYAVMIDREAQRLDALDREKIQAWTFEEFDAGVNELSTDMKREYAKLRRR